MLFGICLIVLISLLVLYLCKIPFKFSRRGVKHFPPINFFGNVWKVIIKQKHTADEIETLYQAFPQERFVGIYELNVPTIVLKDLDLIKKIMVKDSEYFIDHRVSVNKDTDPIFGRKLLALKGEEWKKRRMTLSPLFTSSKIQAVLPFMVEVGEQMINALQQNIQASKGNFIDIDVKTLMSQHGADVAASCILGLKLNSHKDDLQHIQKLEAATMTHKHTILAFVFIAFPKIMNTLKLPFFSRNATKRIMSFIQNAIEDPKNNNDSKPCVMHFMKSKLAIPDIDIETQLALFLLDNYVTVATAMTFLLLEIAIHPEVQERLVQEIQQIDHKTRGKIEYSEINGMKYLDMVVLETLRKWPPFVSTDRVCTKDYNLGKPNDKAEDYIIHKKEGILIPVYSLHRDPDHFPDPDSFDPERFSDENKRNIKPYSYIPFGIGPRKCIGERFALLEVKVMVFQILRSLKLCAAAKTQVKPRLATDTIGLKIQGGHWVRFKQRN